MRRFRQNRSSPYFDALARAPVSYVAPARETSILFGTLLGITVLGEGEIRRRVLAAAAMLLGVTALALG